MTSEPPAATTVLRLRPDRPQRLEALLLGAGPHLEAVLDVAPRPTAICCSCCRRRPSRLPALLEAPGSLSAGEAVTVLVPLARRSCDCTRRGSRTAASVRRRSCWTRTAAPRGRRRSRRRCSARSGRPRSRAGRRGRRRVPGARRRAARTGRGRDADGGGARRARRRALRAWRRARAPVRPAEVVAIGTPARLLPAVPAQPRPQRAGGSRRPSLPSRAYRSTEGVARARRRPALLVVARRCRRADPRRGAPAARPTAGAHRSPRPRRSPGGASQRAPPSPRCWPSASGASPPGARRASAASTPWTRPCSTRTCVPCARAWRRCAWTARGCGSRPPRGGTALATAGEVTVLAIRDRNGWRLRDVVAEPPDAVSVRCRGSPGSRRPRAAA